MKTERSFDGNISNLPRWVRRALAPLPRRLLVAPTTIYFTIAGSILVHLDLHTSFLCVAPAYALLFEICQNANRQWYQNRAYELEQQGAHTPDLA